MSLPAGGDRETQTQRSCAVTINSPARSEHFSIVRGVRRPLCPILDTTRDTRRYLKFDQLRNLLWLDDYSRSMHRCGRARQTPPRGRSLSCMAARKALAYFLESDGFRILVGKPALYLGYLRAVSVCLGLASCASISSRTRFIPAVRSAHDLFYDFFEHLACHRNLIAAKAHASRRIIPSILAADLG